MPRKSRSHNTIPSEGIPLPTKTGRTKILGDGYVKVNSRVWFLALDLAENNAHRIQVHSAESVTVHNNTEWRKKSA